MAYTLSKHARRSLEVADPSSLKQVGAGVCGLLRAEARGERSRAEVDEALLHTLLSLEAPRADRVHLQARLAGQTTTMRSAAAALADWPKWQHGPAITAVETADTGFFDVDAREAFRRVVSVYTVDWSNFMPYAPTVRAQFMRSPAAAQQDFLRWFFALYEEDTEVTHLPGAEQAAAFLREHRVHRARHTFVIDPARVGATPAPLPDPAVLERTLREALEAWAALTSTVHAALDDPSDRSTLAAMAAEAKRVRDGLVEPPVCVEVLTALSVPPPQVALQGLAAAAQAIGWTPAQLADVPLSEPLAAAMPALASTFAALSRAAAEVTASAL